MQSLIRAGSQPAQMGVPSSTKSDGLAAAAGAPLFTWGLKKYINTRSCVAYSILD